jgi:sugar-specific transcriptional regulator TrmB
MDELTERERAIELLQQLGLKEYESKAYVALSRLPQGTAKQISEVSEIPRTRVYDAVRVLETKGLVEIQHSSPQQFRAVSIDEAAETLRDTYESRVETLRDALQQVEPVDTDRDTEVTHEVWALSGRSAIQSRNHQLIDEAEEEVVLVVGHAPGFTEKLRERLQSAQHRGVSLVIGTAAEDLQTEVQRTFPDAEVFVSGLEWLSGTAVTDDDTQISRLLLVDRSTILVSTYNDTATGGFSEKAVFGRGFDNGLVAIVRRLMATGLLPVDDPRAKEM